MIGHSHRHRAPHQQSIRAAFDLNVQQIEDFPDERANLILRFNRPSPDDRIGSDFGIGFANYPYQSAWRASLASPLDSRRNNEVHQGWTNGVSFKEIDCRLLSYQKSRAGCPPIAQKIPGHSGRKVGALCSCRSSCAKPESGFTFYRG